MKTMVEETLFVIGRIIFGLTLTFFGLNHFMNLDQMKGYAEFKGVPAPALAVIGTGLLLIIGGISIGAGIYPIVGIISLAVFFIGVTPKMHDFWNADDENQQNEMILFLKNMALLGATLIFAITLNIDWPGALTQ